MNEYIILILRKYSLLTFNSRAHFHKHHINFHTHISISVNVIAVPISSPQHIKRLAAIQRVHHYDMSSYLLLMITVHTYIVTTDIPTNLYVYITKAKYM